MMFTYTRKLICLVLINFSYHQSLLANDEVIADPAPQSEVIFIQEDSADCSVGDGKLILIKNTSLTKNYEVWIDRWFMDVQTPDHTKQILKLNGAPAPLGCSAVRAGGKQHWSIHSIKVFED